MASEGLKKRKLERPPLLESPAKSYVLLFAEALKELKSEGSKCALMPHGLTRCRKEMTGCTNGLALESPSNWRQAVNLITAMLCEAHVDRLDVRDTLLLDYLQKSTHRGHEEDAWLLRHILKDCYQLDAPKDSPPPLEDESHPDPGSPTLRKLRQGTYVDPVVIHDEAITAIYALDNGSRVSKLDLTGARCEANVLPNPWMWDEFHIARIELHAFPDHSCIYGAIQGEKERCPNNKTRLSYDSELAPLLPLFLEYETQIAQFTMRAFWDGVVCNKDICRSYAISKTRRPAQRRPVTSPLISRSKGFEDVQARTETSTRSRSEPIMKISGIRRSPTLTLNTVHNLLEQRFKDSIKGNVYVLRTEEENVVKIGKAAVIERRLSQLRKGCAMPNLHEFHSVLVSHHGKLEELVHAELRRFKAEGCEGNRCKLPEHEPLVTKSVCSKKCSGRLCKSQHREWFRVTPRVAKEVVDRWHDFMKQYPYSTNGHLREFWRLEVEKLPGPSSNEEDCFEANPEEHHRLRNQRFREWFEEAKSRDHWQPVQVETSEGRFPDGPLKGSSLFDSPFSIKWNTLVHMFPEISSATILACVLYFVLVIFGFR